MEVNAEAGEPLNFVADIQFPFGIENLALLIGDQALANIFGVARGQRLIILELLQLPVNP